MSTYAILVTDDANGNFTPTIIRSPATLPAGGTRLNIPWITNTNFGNASVVITSATTATPIVITTAAAHGFVTGDSVYIQRAVPATDTVENITGTYQFTKTGATTGSLDGSVGSGTYTASSATVTKLTPAKEPATATQAALRSLLDDRASGG